MNKFILNSESGRISERSCRRNSHHMLPVTDYLSDLPEAQQKTDMVEVQFKNTRKGYYRNEHHLPLEKGVMVAVEGSAGHDVGEVTLTGQLVLLQMKKNRIDVENYEARSIYRIATEADLQRAKQAHALEHDTMIEARRIAKEMELQMKIGDVEYQGDGSKAIFYYIADGRVDFRQLIKVYAETFRIRIEMKQIGARQEAGRIGGTGPCGRELCCSKWMTRFTSVGTGAARLQNISPNPTKLAGQCAKLRCCLNYETPTYEETVRQLPNRNIPLETLDGTYYVFSTDPLRGELTYSTDQRALVNAEVISADRAKEIIEMNRHGKKPDSLGGKSTTADISAPMYTSGVGQESADRFSRKNRNSQPRQNNPRNEQRQGFRQKRTHVVILIALLSLLSSCHEKIVYAAHKDINETSWLTTDTVCLPLQITDTADLYDLQLTLRHNDQYQYQNLWLFATLHSPSDSLLLTDTVQAFLADDRGQWLSRRSGRYYNGYIRWLQGCRLTEEGKYTLSVVHGMRDDALKGLADVGVEITIADTK